MKIQENVGISCLNPKKIMKSCDLRNYFCYVHLPMNVVENDKENNKLHDLIVVSSSKSKQPAVTRDLLSKS